ncbi:MAG: hypothetical protein KDD10_06655 [Phaeodactylibacter sp.]|nr:hypothetical protein [Phaeodactylibacter sp.]MCB9292139.1 hypothetical protein [Lewinellaceae bacterium]
MQPFTQRRGELILLAFVLSALFPVPGYPAEVPRVAHFTKQQYNAQNQNWSICQGPDKRMYFGNSGGLLMYDGANWQCFSTPGQRLARAVASDAAGRVFVGGYAKAGYWAPDGHGQFKYHSLLDQVSYEKARREEIWHFLPTDRGLFFQSFSTVYRYWEGQVEVIVPPGNTMFLREVGGRILAPVIYEGLYEYLPDGRFEFLPGSEPLAGKRVATILPLEGSAFLAATQDDGLYQYSAGRLQPWGGALNQELKSVQVNKGIRLRNGNFAFGTILSGVYIVSPEGALLFHINQENGLQNNTVLALFEDDAGNLWAGLDKGIDLIVANSSLSYFSDKKGEVGSVFAAALFQDRLYIGTNQGVFFKRWPSQREDAFELAPDTQGQAWELKVRGGQIFCAHNDGVLLIGGNAVRRLYAETGVYHILDVPFRDSLLLLATYTGLAVLRDDGRGNWAYAHTVKGFEASAKDAFFDPQGRLWAAHPHQGVFCLRFNNEFTEVRPAALPVPEGLPPLEKLRAGITYWAGKACIWPDSGKLAYDVRAAEIHPVSEEEAFPGHRGALKWVPGRGGDLFKLFPHYTEYIGRGAHAYFDVSLVASDEHIISLNDSLYLISTEDGYVILNTRRVRDIKELAVPKPVFSTVEVKSRGRAIHVADALEGPLVLNPPENSLRFFFGLPFYAQHINLRCRLLGFEQEWGQFGRAMPREYTNLPPGSYEFQVQPELTGEAASFFFVIRPYWYQAIWFKLVLAAALIAAGRLLYKAHENRLARQKRQLEVKKERELQRQKIYSRNQMLQAEIKNKSRKLADSTMELVRKNEMLIRLKKELSQMKKKKEPENTGQHLHKMIRQIDSHLSSEEDWKVFESNFNQLHDQFFKRLKGQYPELTPGDLRLAAYLKMNLASKEIAPLLNISLRGVENKRYRLRRKMGLGPEANLTEFLMQF